MMQYKQKVKGTTWIFIQMLGALLVLGVIWINILWVKKLAITLIAILILYIFVNKT